MEAKHTELPWIVDPDDPYAFINVDWGGIGIIHNEPAEVEPLMVMARANTKFVCLACNAHYDLLEACKDFVHLEKTNMTKKQVQLYIDRAKAAIAKATYRKDISCNY